ncbi:MAG TPA: EamA family transporter [Methanocella sp.]|nr:EamA family transporter [Methanocella sp.]
MLRNRILDTDNLRLKERRLFVLSDRYNGRGTMDRQNIYPAALAIAGAILFGASAPLAKLLLGKVDPIMLAALLYLGCGMGLLAFRVFIKGVSGGTKEAGLSRSDLPWVAGSVFAGGIAAPILLMVGLQSTPASTGSLLLNFECVATTIIAVGAFREEVCRRVLIAIGLITVAAVLLTVDFAGAFGISVGALAIIGACVFWGIDNNLTNRISAKDPVVIGLIKGIAAGSFSLLLAMSLGRPAPPGLIPAGLVLALGAISYGLSIVLYIRSSRSLGAARTSAWFGFAPFAGAILALVIFRDAPMIQMIVSLPPMIAGALLLFGEKHSHAHVHPAIEHEHLYQPDAHHPFETGGACRHTHEEIRHSHPHRPDIHHRHSHNDEPNDRKRPHK